MSPSPWRDPAEVHRLAQRIAERARHPWTLMEVCGGQTHAIVRYGLDRLLPPNLSLLHGPGCPVCVTPDAAVDRAIALAALPGMRLCSFGDMLRVPGTQGDLLGQRARGADLRVVLSPLDALDLARQEPDHPVVFFAVGFETTAPAAAMAVAQAAAEGLENFSLLVSHVRVPPALEALCADPDCRVDGFLAAGHVCAVMGIAEYEPLAARIGRPIVVTGFEPVDLMRGILSCVDLLEAGEIRVFNAYGRVAPDAGNPAARAMVEQIFEVVDQDWRGIGRLPASGLKLRDRYRAFDAALRYPVTLPAPIDRGCRAGDVLQGHIQPPACPRFGVECTPDHPLGPPMVSSEGACAAFYQHRSPR